MTEPQHWLALGVLGALTMGSPARAQPSPLATVRIVELKSSDGTELRGSYFPAGKVGPAVLFFPQNNRSRDSWQGVARQLAASGISALAVDSRGHGDSGGKPEEALQKLPADLEACFQFLMSQPGVQHDAIGLAGAGSLGTIDAVETARLHASSIKSLLIMSGETFRPGVEFLHQAAQLPELFIVADSDEYPPTAEAMLWMYERASSPMRKLIHYSAAADAPWLWYETSDPNKVHATGSHGTDLFETHPDLPDIITQWFVGTLIKTPGHAPIDPLAAADTLNQLALPGGAAQVRQQLIALRKDDPAAQLFPEASLDIIASGFSRQADIARQAGNLRDATVAMGAAIEIFRLNAFAYADSADAQFNLADAYSTDGQKRMARQYAEKALAMIDSHAAPLSSWSDTQSRRAEIRSNIEALLKALTTTH